MNKNTGGQAFPSPMGDIGMTLRDFIAVHALQGLLAGSSVVIDGSKTLSFVEASYRYADEMIAQREKE